MVEERCCRRSGKPRCVKARVSLESAERLPRPTKAWRDPWRPALDVRCSKARRSVVDIAAPTLVGAVVSELGTGNQSPIRNPVELGCRLRPGMAGPTPWPEINAILRTQARRFDVAIKRGKRSKASRGVEGRRPATPGREREGSIVATDSPEAPVLLSRARSPTPGRIPTLQPANDFGVIGG